MSKKFLNDICKAVGHDIVEEVCERCHFNNYVKVVRDKLEDEYMGTKNLINTPMRLRQSTIAILAELMTREEILAYRDVKVCVPAFYSGYDIEIEVLLPHDYNYYYTRIHIG